MTAKSILRLIGKFVHFVLTMVGAFFVLFYLGEVMLHYTVTAREPDRFFAYPIIPAVILAAIYTWLERPRKGRVHTLVPAKMLGA